LESQDAQLQLLQQRVTELAQAVRAQADPASAKPPGSAEVDLLLDFEPAQARA
jgi:hypothetical protein